VRRASNVLVASAMTMWLGCSEVDKLTESKNENSKAGGIALSAESPTIPVNGATNVEVKVTEADGGPVKDGTSIAMTATLGRIEPTDVRTQNGRALVAYRAAGAAGSAKVTAASGEARAELTITVENPTVATPPSGSATTSATFDLRQVTWLDPDVSSWPETSRITSATIDNPPICIRHTKAGQWPVKGGAEGNPWIFVNRDGRWYGATYEWLAPGQVCKGLTRDTIGPHIGRSPLTGWRPRSGEVVGLMVSTLARFRPEAARERSNVVMVRWP
jgi:hypothetical protein